MGLGDRDDVRAVWVGVCATAFARESGVYALLVNHRVCTPGRHKPSLPSHMLANRLDVKE